MIYRDPRKFGRSLYDKVIGYRGFGYNDESMKDMINAFGTIMMFAFIEASRPSTDRVKAKGKGIISNDRYDLIQSWALNAVPIGHMFRAFYLVFTRQLGEIAL